MDYRKRTIIIGELVISAVRSSGPGGQNVNKVNTKVELRLNIAKSEALTDDEKLLLKLKLANRINENHELIITDQSSRSQLKNKNCAIEKLFLLIDTALKSNKKRIATKPTKASKLKRIQDKKLQSMKKQLRRKDY